MIREANDLEEGMALQDTPKTDISPEALMRQIQKDDSFAFEKLLKMYKREMFAYLRGFLMDADAADDVLQNTFLQIFLKANQFDSTKRFRPWLYTIANNQAIDWQRRNKRHRMPSLNQDHGSAEETAAYENASLLDLLPNREALPEDRAEFGEDFEKLYRLLSQMDESHREVLSLIHFQQLKYREAAEVLEVPVGTIKSRQHAAMLKLTQLWYQDQAPEISHVEVRSPLSKRPQDDQLHAEQPAHPILQDGAPARGRSHLSKSA